MDPAQLQHHAYNLLEQNYQHQEWFIRFSACEAFAHVCDDRGLDTVVEGLQHQSALIRERAVKAIAASQKAEFCSVIDKYASQDSDAHTRGQAILAFAQLNSGEYFTQIANALRDKSDYVKKCAVESLPICGNKKAVGELKKIANGDYELPYLLRLEGAYHLARKHQQGYKFLYEMLDCADAWVQFLTAQKLAELGKREALPVLQNMIVSGDWDHKLAAIESILKLGESAISPTELLKPTETPDIRTKITATLILYNQHPEAAQKIVSNALNAKDEELQLHVVEQISQRQHYSLLRFAEPLLQYGRENVRAAIVVAVEKSRQPQLVYLLEPVLLRSHWILGLQAAKATLKILLCK
ncbi:HEAT repeat domain-containing protein [Candidatus Uabimicrobium amorphum]|uniref:HEAT repeat-containing PBS lyase n=1 Tax=Uabimicrobium amorphum TaxID=2596890 RepID=A0A5S9ITM5_UABAM|nr:HEAT repeat domain-containing protein [Candidatus Uabimicrobium amorphum]BBM87714.1 HEAT repeat-containing PBS lyase [Candidatus Uabimicrobium amorphum]